MNARRTRSWSGLLLIAALSTRGLGQTQPAALPKVEAPPETFFQSVDAGDRDVARAFYAKHLALGGLHIVASKAVDDAALLRTRDIVGHMLAGRPDVLAAMQKAGTRLIVIGRDEVYTDMPDYRHEPNPDYLNERVRGTGGLDVTSFGEENLLALPIDRYDDESIAVHEFCHTIDAALETIDPTWKERLRTTYRNALDKGRWHNAYTSTNPAEYFAEIGQSYFDCNRINNWNHANIATREQLKAYDPEGYELCRTTFNLSPEQDWRFTPVRVRPFVSAPPAKLKIDPFYAKFTYAREMTVLGSAKVSDAAMLKANDTIRKLFAYRHDILRALINERVRLVVLATGQTIRDLPEYKTLATPSDNTRYLEFSPDTRLILVPEENLLATPNDPLDGTSGVIAGFARATYALCATRPVDPKWDNRPRQIWQQYELRVKRLDVSFDDQLKTAYDNAGNKGLWRGTPADQDRATYWVAGVLAYFDAAGRGVPPQKADRPITTREALKAYDPDLYSLVDTTFAYTEHPDYRYTPGTPAPTAASPYPYAR